MTPFKAFVFLSLGITAGAVYTASSQTHPPTQIHYAPAENLERIDATELAGAQQEISLAAYVLTDWPVIQALTAAADRGVKVRLYLDGGMTGEEPRSLPFKELAATDGVEIRTKPKGAPLMHLKSYEIDGRVLRTGSANFSASGLKRQDNDLVLIEDSGAAMRFKTEFEGLFVQGEKLP